VRRQDAEFIKTLATREEYRDQYWENRDPIADERLLWRAQSFRHMVHLLPHQSILELGCGKGHFTRQLVRVTRGENPITSTTFSADSTRSTDFPGSVEFLPASSLPGELQGRRFDFIVAIDLLDRRNCTWMLQNVYELLSPGGQVLFYESNPWNLFLKLRRTILRCFGRKDPRHLLSRPQLYELISEIGFVRIFAVYNDFVFWPLSRSLVWVFRNLSILLENAPALRTLAGSILVHTQKPPRVAPPKVSLFEHEALRGAVSVVIPCYNEEMNVRPLITRLRELFGGYLHEIIPIDDNSTDGTRRELERLAFEDPLIKPVFRNPPNGVGRALMDGYRVATGRYVLSMDCDFQHLLPEMRDIFDAAAQGYDVVVGSRFSRHSVLLNYPFQKIIANRAFHALAQLILLRRFRDLTNNLKLIRREVVDLLQLRHPGFAVNAEAGLQPLLMGFSVKEVPISWINRTPDMGTSSFRLFRVGGGYCQVLYHLWLQCVFGTGLYKGLIKSGKHRKTLRDDGVIPSKMTASR
jgi:SAM-dependent methyltransferase